MVAQKALSVSGCGEIRRMEAERGTEAKKVFCEEVVSGRRKWDRAVRRQWGVMYVDHCDHILVSNAQIDMWGQLGAAMVLGFADNIVLSGNKGEL